MPIPRYRALLSNSPIIRQSFLEDELHQGILRAKNTTIQLTDEANTIMQTVSDIVALPPLREDGVVRACDEAMIFKDQTIEKLVNFDTLQTKAVVPVESILQSITNQIQFMEDIFIGGDTSVDAQTIAVDGMSSESQIEDLFKTLLFQKAIEHLAKARDQESVMLAIKNVINIDKFLGEAQRIYNEVKNDPIFKTMLWATRIYLSSSSQDESIEKKTEDENLFVKSLNRLKGIGKDFKDGLGSRTDKAWDSPYHLANYLTLGAVDGIWSGSKNRNEKKWNSTSDFFNYATFGFTGMAKGAVNPKDPLSKEHWLDSFGLATTITGVKGVSSKKPTSGSGKTSSSSSDKILGKSIK